MVDSRWYPEDTGPKTMGNPSDPAFPSIKCTRFLVWKEEAFVVCMLMVKVLSIDETLGSSIKQTTPQRGNGRTKREDPSLSHKSKT
jgi:hypothetical protein